MKYIIKSEILKFNMDDIMQIVNPTKPIDAGRYSSARGEPYKLMAYLAHQYYGGLFYDIGTRRGTSALALGSRKQNKVISWDIQDNSRKLAQYAYPNISKYPNIEFRIKDIFDESDLIYDNADLISLDIDPHDGIQEKKFLDILDRTKFKGILLMDDINYYRSPDLKKLWESIIRPKFEIQTSYSHESGTGLVSYGEEIIVDNGV
jgi:hypothetical protein